MKLKNILYILIISSCVILSCSKEIDLQPTDIGTYIKMKGEADFRLTAIDATILESGNILLLANATADNGSISPYILELDEVGTTVWSTVVNHQMISHSLAVIDDNTFLIGGEAGNNIDVILTNSSGQVVGEYNQTQTNLEEYANRAKAVTYDPISEMIFIAGEVASLNQIKVVTYKFDKQLSPESIEYKKYSSEKLSITNSLISSTFNSNNETFTKIYWAENDPSSQKVQLSSAIFGEIESESPVVPVGFNFVASSFIKDNLPTFAIAGTSNGSLTMIIANTENQENSLPLFLKPSTVGTTISTSQNGKYVVGGTYNGEASNGSEDFIIAFVDNVENELVKIDERIYGGENSDRLKKVLTLKNGEILMFGDTIFGNVRTLLIIKTDFKGDL